MVLGVSSLLAFVLCCSITSSQAENCDLKEHHHKALEDYLAAFRDIIVNAYVSVICVFLVLFLVHLYTHIHESTIHISGLWTVPPGPLGAKRFPWLVSGD